MVRTRFWLLLICLHLPSPVAAQDGRARLLEATSIRPRVGVSHPGRGNVVIGVSLAVPVHARLSAVASVQRWAFDTGCPSVTPSTCGDDGWGAVLGGRADLPLSRSLLAFLEAGVGFYRFSGDGRAGDTTRSLGLRGGLDLIGSAGPGLEVAVELQSLASYERDGLRFPVMELEALQFGLLIPL